RHGVLQPHHRADGGEHRAGGLAQHHQRPRRAVLARACRIHGHRRLLLGVSHRDVSRAVRRQASDRLLAAMDRAERVAARGDPRRRHARGDRRLPGRAAVAAPARRYLAIVTLGFGEIIRVLILNIDTIGAARGLSGIPQYSTFFWVFGTAVLVIVVARRIATSTHGRALFAIRDDEVAAEALGVDTTKYKVLAFVLGAFFAGVAGGLFAHFLS